MPDHPGVAAPIRGGAEDTDDEVVDDVPGPAHVGQTEQDVRVVLLCLEPDVQHRGQSERTQHRLARQIGDHDGNGPGAVGMRHEVEVPVGVVQIERVPAEVERKDITPAMAAGISDNVWTVL